MGRTKRNANAFKVALAGISAAFVTLFLALAHYSPVGKLSFYFLSGLVLLLPLTTGSLWTCAMAYIAGGALGIIFSPLGVLPYAVIFGLQTLLFGVQRRFQIKPYLALPVKGVLFVGALYLTFLLYGVGEIQTAFEWVGIPFRFLYLALLLTTLYLVYDYCLKFIFGWLQRRMGKVAAKYMPKEKKTNPKNQAEKREEEEVFDLFEEQKVEEKDEKDREI